MRKTILALVAAAMPMSAMAADTNYGKITYVEKVFVDRYVDRIEQQCQDVEVPIYGRTQGGGATGGDVLTGMIIGGLIGKGATGKDNGAAAGAVIGGIIAADKGNQGRQVVTGYRTERQCSNVSVRVNEPVVSHYIVEFKYLGETFSAETQKRYRKGQNIRVYLSVD